MTKCRPTLMKPAFSLSVLPLVAHAGSAGLSIGKEDGQGKDELSWSSCARRPGAGPCCGGERGAVLRLLRGGYPDLLVRTHSLTVATLRSWRDAFLVRRMASPSTRRAHRRRSEQLNSRLTPVMGRSPPAPGVGVRASAAAARSCRVDGRCGMAGCDPSRCPRDCPFTAQAAAKPTSTAARRRQALAASWHACASTWPIKRHRLQPQSRDPRKAASAPPPRPLETRQDVSPHVDATRNVKRRSQAKGFS